MTRSMLWVVLLSLPGCRYQKLPDEVVDKKTGLTWQRHVPAEAVTLAEAGAACAALSLGGASDWRLPDPDELASLLLDDRKPTFDESAFPRTPPGHDWRGRAQGAKQYTVYFPSLGLIGALGQGESALVRCVRGEPSSGLTRFQLSRRAVVRGCHGAA